MKVDQPTNQWLLFYFSSCIYHIYIRFISELSLFLCLRCSATSPLALWSASSYFCYFYSTYYHLLLYFDFIVPTLMPFQLYFLLMSYLNWFRWANFLYSFSQKQNYHLTLIMHSYLPLIHDDGDALKSFSYFCCIYFLILLKLVL